MPQIQRIQVFAVFDNMHLGAGMPFGIVSVQRGKRRVVRAQRVLPEAHRHSEFNVRKALVDLVRLVVIHKDVEHIHLFQVREFFEERVKIAPPVHLPHTFQVDIFCLRIGAEILKRNRFAKRARGNHQNHQEDQQPPEFFHRFSAPSFIRFCFSIQTVSTATSAGFTPGIRPAAPSDTGFCFASFCRASRRRCSISS